MNALFVLLLENVDENPLRPKKRTPIFTTEAESFGFKKSGLNTYSIHAGILLKEIIVSNENCWNSMYLAKVYIQKKIENLGLALDTSTAA